MNSYIKTEQLKNLFFYTFGIVPLDEYGVVGDGMTDNRLQIQQAINDAVANDIKYIFVTKGEYNYSNSLRDTDKVTFIGNSVDTSIEGVEIKQFPDFQIPVGDQVPIGAIILFDAEEEIPENYEEIETVAPTGLKYIKRVG